MSDNTKNYGFLTPGLSGAANITVQDGNWEKADTVLAEKVDKVSGKGLSTNDFTDEEKERLAQLYLQTLAPPTLTSTTADGTAIGTDGWTGTGWFCKTADTKYTADDSVNSKIDGFNRFCLKPITDNGEWQNWTPYFDYDGTAYEFFYAPSRGLYEALIPANTQTAAQIVAAIRWENHPPTKLMYGKATNICGIYTSDCEAYNETDTTVANYWIRNIGEYRATEGPLRNDDYAAVRAIFLNKYDFSDLDINMVSLLHMAADLDGDQDVNMSEVGAIKLYIKGNITQFDIQTIDNF